MTNKERFISLLGFAPSFDSVDGALIDAGILGTSPYDGTNVIALKKAAIELLQLLLTTADVSDGNATAGFVHSVKYDRVAILARIKLLKGELGVTDESLPTINTKAVW